jgi:eukaryotic-like serine/threonine-protein kinase
MTSSDENNPRRTADNVAAADQPSASASDSGAHPTGQLDTRSLADPQATAIFQGHVHGGTSSSSPSTPLPKVPGYEIIGLLGRGGMGVVYKARHLALKRNVALKMILVGGHADDDTRHRFRAEAEAVARLQHPNIVQVHEVGEHDGLPYAALEYVEGGTFAQKLLGGPLPPRDAARVVETLARAMQLAHSRNIVHRDLKPANVLLDAGGSPKVTDFGLARQLDDISQTQTGAVIGTPSYISPEQADGNNNYVGPATDVYALGAILYECLSGRPPFQGHSIVATLDMVRSQEPVAPRTLRPRIPADLETICLKCLRKEPETRYASADALADDLLRWQRGEPIAARPVHLGERLIKWIYRRPAVAALIVVVNLSLAGLLGLGVWSYSSISRALKNESAERLKSQRMSAGLAFDRAQQLCQEGKTAEGLLWLTECLAVNPEEDRALDEIVRLNLAAWRAPLTVQRATVKYDSGVACVACSPDGKTFILAAGGSVRLCDASTGEPLGKAMVHPSDVSSVAISHDGRLVATGAYDKTVRIWDLATRELIGQPIPQTDIVNDVKFSRDDRWLVAATGFRDHSVASSARVWDVATGEPVTPPLPHPATLMGADFTADGRHVVTGAYDGQLRYWSVATGQLDGEPMRVSGEVTSMALSRTGTFLAATCNNGEAFVFHTADRRQLAPPVRHSGHAGAVAFHPDESMLAVGGIDGTVSIWEWMSGQQTTSRLVHQNYVASVAFSPDGRQVVTGSHDKHARIWDLPLYCRKGIPLVQSDRALWLGFLDPSLVSARPRAKITGDQNRPIPHWVWEYICGAFSPDGRYVVTGSIDNLGRVWEVDSGRLVGKALRHDNWVRAVAFAPDNRRVLTGSHDMTARLWDIETGEPLTPSLHHSAGIVAVAISRDGTKGLTGSTDRTARLWNLKSGEPIGPPMLHAGDVFAVAFSDDGRFVLTGSSRGGEGDARLWDAASATPIGPPARHERGVTSVRFDDDGQSFLTLCDDGASRRWPMPQPIEGDPGQVQRWVHVITGQKQDAAKSVSMLDAGEWRERRAAVMASPLATDLEGTTDNVLAWHDAMVGANEISFHGDAARWHLDYLLKARPQDGMLHARRAGTFHRYQDDVQTRKELELARELGGLSVARDWCAERAENLERLHQHEAALWYRQWIADADSSDPLALDNLGHCLARLGRFDEATEQFRRAVQLAPERIEFQRDLSMARLAVDDRDGFRKACARMVELAETSGDREAAHTAALSCVFDADAVSDWGSVVRLAARTADWYEGDYRIHIAALLRAGCIDEAVQRPWATPTPYAHVVWEWYFHGMLFLRAGRLAEARPILEQKFNMIDFMDQAMPKDPNSKVWSDWIYYVLCHTLRKEAEALLRAAEP